MLEQDLLLLFKGACTGFFYTFISISGIILVAHYIIGKNFRLGLTAALGIVAVQVLWSAIALLIMMGLIKSANINHPGFALIGSAILFIMAVKIYRKREKFDQHDTLSRRPLKAFAAGALTSLVIPIRILGFAAIFAAIRVHTTNLNEGISPVVGVAIGSFLFWLIFSLSIHYSKKMISPKTLQKFHRYAALVLIVFSLIGLLQQYF
ncbi:LysE family transporter [Candidatus Neptunichlamydia sp. REUL1]|uniref:LysE family transporter n=1 Tax=Candidatus Neptunichlamydia sp. REUL1 TaxID=3064277 RepID=UPI0029311A56|nr:LysE family transporter [Candidatus Neptunochlamydia sp. REUL1]